MSYVPLHAHSYFSILDGFGSPKANVARAKKLGLPAISITDHGNTYGHLAHWQACKKAGIKPILGCELYVVHKSATQKDNSNRMNSHMVIWAKNKAGWKSLTKLVSRTSDLDYFYYKPRISLEELKPFLDGNIMAMSGHQGSHLSDCLFADLYGDYDKAKADIKRAYGQYKNPDVNFYRQFLKPNWLESTCELALRLQDLFGKGNFFIELQNELDPKDQLALWIHPLIVECLREVSKKTGIPAVASSDPHYPSPEDAMDQRLMVMTNLKETEESVEKKLASTEDMDVMVFFGSENFYIHSYEEMKQKFTDEELAMTLKIADQVEIYDITHKPYFPDFKVPEFNKKLPYMKDCKTDYDRYLYYLCVEGAKKLKPWDHSDWKALGRTCTKEEYWNRLQQEMTTLVKFGLTSYFLVVWDYCMAADYRPADHKFDWRANLEKKGPLDPIPRGVGRGSAAGCLVSYLIGITGIDPMLYGLMFSRFFNEGRCTADHVELPDCDIDFAVEDRDWVIAYLQNRYGENNVAQMITFQRMQGKAAIKDIFRVKGVEGGFELSNEICKSIPDEAMIADELQEAREAGHENFGIISWTLANSDEILKYYENPKLKPLFDQAIRCEGTKRAQGRHPSGIVVTPEPVADCFPMTLDTKSKKKIVAFDMNDAAKCGATKLDLLGTAVLDKLKMTQDLINGVTPRRSRIDEYKEEE